MNSRAIGCLLLFVSACALGWFVLDGSTTRPRVTRSRLTIVVETPEGERSGSSVTQETTSFPGGLTRAQGWAILGKLVGEAAFIDLGSRGILVATFESQWALARGGGGTYNAALAPFPQEKFSGVVQQGMSENGKYAAYLDEVNRLKPKGEIPFKYLPVFVRFRDPTDPTSVDLVDPSNLAESFGTGVSFKGATVEITDDPVTHGIENRLPWLKSSREAQTLFPQAYLMALSRTQKLSPVQHLRFTDFRRLPQ